MKKAYIQPEFDLLKLSSAEDILNSPLTGEAGDDNFNPDDVVDDFDKDWT